QPLLRRWTVRARHEQLIDPEIVLLAAAHRHAEHREDRFVEAAAGAEVGDHKLDMVDQPTAMNFVRFHPGHLCSLLILPAYHASRPAVRRPGPARASASD